MREEKSKIQKRAGSMEAGGTPYIKGTFLIHRYRFH
jgi:hypothetical protein